MENSTILKSNENSRFSFTEALKRLISGFSERSREIIKARYGIGFGEPKTLQKIGKEKKITRERVRQIIQEVLKKSRGKEKNPVIWEAEQNIAFTIGEKSGIIDKEELLSIAGKGGADEEAAAGFFLDCVKSFVQSEIKNELKKSFALPDFDIEEWRKLKNAARNILESEKRVLSDDELEVRIAHRYGSKIPAKKIFDYLAVSEEIRKNNFGKWGISEWEEVTPKNTREKAYLVLKEAGGPLHFTKIAGLIDKYKLNRKKTHFQTVHNELIKDDRFVLVGRGVYALSEWGYKKGTVKEILEDILRKNRKPMKKEDILDNVLKVRQVKKSTIMINLNNFSRIGKDEYTVQK